MMRTGWNHAIQIQQNVGRTFFFEHFSVAISKLQPGGVLHRRTNLACVCEQNTHRVEHVKNRAGPLYRLSCCLLYMLLPCLFDCFNAYPDNSSPLLFTKTATVFQPGEKLRRPMHCSLIMSSICLLSWKLAIFICMPYLHRIYTITWRFVHASINTGTVQKRLLEYLLISWNIWFSPPTKRLQGFKRIISVIARRLKKDLVSMLKKLSTARQVVLLIFFLFSLYDLFTLVYIFSHLFLIYMLQWNWDLQEMHCLNFRLFSFWSFTWERQFVHLYSNERDYAICQRLYYCTASLYCTASYVVCGKNIVACILNVCMYKWCLCKCARILSTY